MALAAYAALVLYASLYPFAWRQPTGPLWEFMKHLGPRPAPSDIAVNFIAYIPLGFLIAKVSRGPGRSFLIAVGTCAALSFGVETAQRFILYRYSALSDFLCDTAGGVAGAWAWLLVRHEGVVGAGLWRGIDRMTGGSPARLAAWCAACAWGVAQAVPIRSGIVVGNVRAWREVARAAVHSSLTFAPREGIGYALTAAAVILVARYSLRLPMARLLLLVLAACTVAGKTMLNGAALPPEWAPATVLGALLALLVPEPDRPTIMAIVALSFLALELTPTPGGTRHPFNFVPFEGEITIRMNGIRVMLEQAWSFMAMAALLTSNRRVVHERGLMWAGANAVGCFVFCLEWAQRHVPGRYGDITTVMIAVVAWLGTWMFVAAATEQDSRRAARAVRTVN